MATAVLTPGAQVSNSGWANPTNIAASDNVYATATAAGSSFVLEMANLPADFGPSGATLQIAVEWKLSATASRAKSILVEIINTSGTVLTGLTYTTPSVSSQATDTVHTSGSLSLSAFTKADLDGARLRVTLQEGGGMGDSITTSVDRVTPTVTYTPAATDRGVRLYWLHVQAAAPTSVAARGVRLYWMRVHNDASLANLPDGAEITDAWLEVPDTSNYATGVGLVDGIGEADSAGSKRASGTSALSGVGSIDVVHPAGDTTRGVRLYWLHAQAPAGGSSSPRGVRLYWIRAHNDANLASLPDGAEIMDAWLEVPDSGDFFSGTGFVDGLGEVDSVGTKRASGTGLVSGVGGIAAVGRKITQAASIIFGSALLAAAGGKQATGTADLTGTGSVQATGGAVVSGVATILGTGSIQATGAALRSGTAAVTGVGGLNATGRKVAAGTVAITGTGTVSATGAPKASGIAVLTGQGAFAVQGQKRAIGTADLTGVGDLQGTGAPEGSIGSLDRTTQGALLFNDGLNALFQAADWQFANCSGGVAADHSQINTTQSAGLYPSTYGVVSVADLAKVMIQWRGWAGRSPIAGSGPLGIGVIALWTNPLGDYSNVQGRCAFVTIGGSQDVLEVRDYNGSNASVQRAVQNITNRAVGSAVRVGLFVNGTSYAAAGLDDGVSLEGTDATRAGPGHVGIIFRGEGGGWEGGNVVLISPDRYATVSGVTAGQKVHLLDDSNNVLLETVAAADGDLLVDLLLVWAPDVRKIQLLSSTDSVQKQFTFPAAEPLSGGDIFNGSAQSATGTATLTGVGSVDAIGSKRAAGAGDLTGAGSLDATGIPQPVGTAVVSGVGSVQATGRKRATGTASLSGVATLDSTGAPVGVGTSSLAGVGTVSAQGSKRAQGTGSVTGTGSVNAVGGTIVSGSSSVSGVGGIDSQGAKQAVGTGSLSGTGTIDTTGTRDHSGTSSVQGAGSAQSVGRKQAEGTSAITGTGIVTNPNSSSRGLRLYWLHAEAPPSGSVAPRGVRLYWMRVHSDPALGGLPLGADITDVYLEVPDGSLFASGTARLEGSGLLSTVGRKQAEGTAEITGTGAVQTPKTVLVPGRSDVAGVGQVSSQGSKRATGTATLEGVGVVEGVGAIFPPLYVAGRVQLVTDLTAAFTKRFAGWQSCGTRPVGGSWAACGARPYADDTPPDEGGVVTLCPSIVPEAPLVYYPGSSTTNFSDYGTTGLVRLPSGRLIVEKGYDNTVFRARTWYSDDNGTTWTESTDVPGDLTGGSNRSLVYDEVHDVLISFDEYGGVSRSLDGGQTWEATDWSHQFDVQVSASGAGGGVVISVGGAMARSDDGGLTWSLFDFENSPLYDVNDPLGEATAYAVGYRDGTWLVGGEHGHLVRSTDGMLTHSVFLPTIVKDRAVLEDLNYGAGTLDYLPNDHLMSLTGLGGGIWLAGTRRGTLLRSVDDGLTWAEVAYESSPIFYSTAEVNALGWTVSQGEGDYPGAYHGVGFITHIEDYPDRNLTIAMGLRYEQRTLRAVSEGLGGLARIPTYWCSSDKGLTWSEAHQIPDLDVAETQDVLVQYVFDLGDYWLIGQSRTNNIGLPAGYVYVQMESTGTVEPPPPVEHWAICGVRPGDLPP